jgi:hypothetical protein
MEIRHAAELADLRTRFELELRTREQNVRSDLERSQLELQQHFEGLLERKEAQVSSLLATVSDTSQRAIEAEERGISLQQEVTKRRELEERLRASITEVATARQLAAQRLWHSSRRGAQRRGGEEGRAKRVSGEGHCRACARYAVYLRY